MVEHQLCIGGLYGVPLIAIKLRKYKYPKNDNFLITCNEKLIIFGGSSKFLSLWAWGTASISEKSKLRTCKILYNYSDNPVTKENLKIAPG